MAKPAAGKTHPHKRGKAPRRQGTGENLLRIGHLKHHIRRNVQMLEALTKPAAVAAGPRGISAEEIFRRFIAILGVADIDLEAPVGDFIPPGTPQAVRAFANVLNNSADFSPDDLNLVPGDMANISKIGQVGAAIIRRYQKNGWTVTG